MNFTTEKAIYVQIADRLCDEILTGKFVDDERIPSVREYAVLLEIPSAAAQPLCIQILLSEGKCIIQYSIPYWSSTVTSPSSSTYAVQPLSESSKARLSEEISPEGIARSDESDANRRNIAMQIFFMKTV